MIVSNCDLHIDTNKPADMPAAFGGNNHGSIVEINGQWYIFYHRQTNGHWFSRQGCIEPIHFDADGAIAQVELTSSGVNGCPLEGKGEYPAYIACNLFTPQRDIMAGQPGRPFVTQESREARSPGFVANITPGTTIGFKYFEIRDVTELAVRIRGYASGAFEIRSQIDGPVLGVISLKSSNVWMEFSAKVDYPKGKQALYLTYTQEGMFIGLNYVALGSVAFK